VLVSLVDTQWTSLQLQDALARQGVFVRECSNFRGLEVGSRLAGAGIEVLTRGHIRLAVRTTEENRRVVGVLEGLMQSRPPQ
jgi:threonine-phosphate decarboxylase